MSVERRRFLGAVGGMSALAVAGCADRGSRSELTGATDTGTIAMHGFDLGDSGGFGEVDAARLRAVRQAYPKVRIVSGDPPDLLYLDRQDIAAYAHKGLIEPLTDLIADADIDMRQFREPVLREVTWNAQFYGIPEYFQTRAVLVREPVLAAAGVEIADLSTRDWDRLYATAKAVTKATRGIGFDPRLPDFLPLWARVNGVDLVHPDGQPNLDDPLVVEALDFTAGLVAEQGGWSVFRVDRTEAFARGRIAAMPMEFREFDALMASGAGAGLTAAPFIDREGQVTGWATGSAWAIAQGSRNQRIAIRIAEAMTSTATWIQAVAPGTFTGLLTANVSADEWVKDHFTGTPWNPAISAYTNDLDRAFALSASPVAEQIREAWQSAATEVLTGLARPAAALKAAQRKASAAYATR